MSDAVQGGTVTFVFTDLVGSTQLIDALGDDESDPLIRQHLRRLRAIVASHEGQVVKSLGDGLMAAFTSAAHAVDAAVHMQQAVAASEDARLQLRIGVNSGEAVYDGIDYYGKPVWVAQRYCNAAEGGQILTSEVVRTLVGTRGSHRFEDRGPIELRGVAEPAPALEVVWEPDPDIDLARLDAHGPRTARGRAALAGGLVALVALAGVAFALTRDEEPAAPEPRDERRERAVVSTPKAVSVHFSDGGLNDSSAGEPSVSNDGVVAFATAAKLVKNDNNGFADVYLSDDDGTRLISVASGVPGDAGSFRPRISADGSRVVFLSRATNLVPDVSDGLTHVYLYDVEDESLLVVSRRNNGRLAHDRSNDPAISATGKYIAFASRARNLALVGDDNEEWDVFRHDVSKGSTLRRSVPTGGGDANGPSVDAAVSPDGIVGFSSQASNLVPDDGPVSDVFFYSLANRPVEVSATDGGEADGPSHSPSLAKEARAVAFVSGAGTLIDNDSNGFDDVFVWTSDGVELVSVSSDEEQANEASSAPVISADGRYVAFLSEASNLVPDDENGTTDAFLRDLEKGTTVRLSTTADGGELDAPTLAFSLSPNARYLAFVAGAVSVDTALVSPVETVFLSQISRAIRSP